MSDLVRQPGQGTATELLKLIRSERRRRWVEEAGETAKARAERKARSAGKTWGEADDRKVLERERKKAEKKYKEPEPVDTTELPQLPQDWCWVRLELVASVVDPHPSHRTPKRYEGGVPYVGLGDMDSEGHIEFDKVRRVAPTVFQEHTERYTLKHGDFVFGKIGTLGSPRTLHPPFVYTISANVILVQPKEQIADPSWLINYLRSPHVGRLIALSQAATSQPAFGIGKLRALAVPIAPPETQHAIVAKLDALLTRSRRAKSALSAIPPLLERFRQSVLAAAFRGDLTADWRARNPDVEPASVLLERIRKERKVCFIEDKAEKARAKAEEKWRAKGKTWSEEYDRNALLVAWKKAEKKYKEPEPVDTTGLPELPKGWCWAKMRELSEHHSKAICAGPFGTIFKAKDFRSEGVPIIFLRHVAPGRYLTHKPGFMDRAKWEELFQSYSIHGGELLVTKLGDPPGVCAIYPEGIGVAMVTPDVIKFETNETFARPRFLMHYLNSEQARRFTFGASYGVTRLRMNLTIFRDMPVPLAPVEEQTRLVEALDEQFALIDAMRNRMLDATEKVTQLDRATLSSAFSGTL